jgi:hypothetical protein
VRLPQQPTPGLSATRADRTIARVMPARSDPVIIPPRSHPDSVRRLMLFFAVVYTVEGIGQAKVGIVWQPLTYFLKTQYGWTALQIAASLSVLDVPWVVKPLYGLLSDFLPLFGYRRRSYLLLSNLAAIVAFVWVTQAVTPAAIVFALVLTSITMAVSSTVCGALLVVSAVV